MALDGISLTVAQVGTKDFTVSLIPHTRQVTNLSAKGEGSLINIEMMWWANMWPSCYSLLVSLWMQLPSPVLPWIFLRKTDFKNDAL